MTKFFLFFISLFVFQTANAVVFAGKEDVFNCGTVISIRNTKQAPMNDAEYQRVYGGSIRSGQTFVQVLGGSAVGVVVGAALGAVTDVVVDSNRKEIPMVVEPEDGWKKVKAMKIKIDDGREINLPLLDEGNNYEVGQRYLLGYSKQLDNIQLVFKGAHVPEQSDEKKYFDWCHSRIDKAVADNIIERSKSLVDESKIF